MSTKDKVACGVVVGIGIVYLWFTLDQRKRSIKFNADLLAKATSIAGETVGVEDLMKATIEDQFSDLKGE
jgi:hypothetical protein